MNLHLDNFYHREIVLTTSLSILDLSIIDLLPQLRFEQDLTPEGLFELKSKIVKVCKSAKAPLAFCQMLVLFEL